MKIVFLSILLLISFITRACWCENLPLLRQFSAADFVALVKVKKTTPVPEVNTHKLDIEIIDLFKGEEVNSIIALTYIGSSSCSFRIESNTTWLVYAKNDGKDISFGSCSGSRKFQENLNSSNYQLIPRSYENSSGYEINFLQYLKSKKIYSKNEFWLSLDLSESLKKYEGKKVKGIPFALYELTISKDLKVIEIKAIKEFDGFDYNHELNKDISENMRVHRIGGEQKIPSKTVFYLALFYHYEMENRPSKISRFHYQNF